MIGNTIGNLAADRIVSAGQMYAIEKDVLAKAQAAANNLPGGVSSNPIVDRNGEVVNDISTSQVV